MPAGKVATASTFVNNLLLRYLGISTPVRSSFIAGELITDLFPSAVVKAKVEKVVE